MQKSVNDLVLLKTCGDNAEASLTRSLLEAAGIQCVVQGEQHRSMLGTIGGYIDLRVLVRAADLDRARELLDQDQAEAQKAAEAEALSGTVPPPEEHFSDEPGAEDPRAARRRKLGLAVMAIVFGPTVFLVLASLLRRCGES
ncbi:MAG TPA: DUF2007 domain-containing protein [Myxococcaceae bacterium]|nr:DUF2007 domain-containing protein [Myxococcaceae bacterium]